jgi:hypothetical protein
MNKKNKEKIKLFPARVSVCVIDFTYLVRDLKGNSIPFKVIFSIQMMALPKVLFQGTMKFVIGENHPRFEEIETVSHLLYEFKRAFGDWLHELEARCHEVSVKLHSPSTDRVICTANNRFQLISLNKPN